LASFEEHIAQANKNLTVLSEINSKITDTWDWQVTVGYYVSVHVANAHIAKVSNLHYRTHEDVKNVLNPFNTLSICKIPEDIYLSYTKIESLSRRARYLCHQNQQNPQIGHFTHDKHFAKSIRHLDKFLDYFKTLHSITFSSCSIKCVELSPNDHLKIFTLIPQN